MPRMGQPSLGQDYFARVYANTDDPWDFASSPYENEKYRATIDALGSRQFQAGFEIGCSVGVLTALLAARCEALLAIDINERALAAAQRRCAGLPNVRFAHIAFPHSAPPERFDFIMLSEVAYYWSDDDLHAAIDYVAHAGSGVTLELVHFLPKVDDYVRDGDAVHAAFLNDARFAPLEARRTERYRLDLLRVR